MTNKASAQCAPLVLVIMIELAIFFFNSEVSNIGTNVFILLLFFVLFFLVVH